MKSIALLEYLFMFDPANTWSSGLDFERDLADFFMAHGYEADWITARGNIKRILYIQKIEQFPKVTKPNLTEPPKQPQKDSVKKAFDNLSRGK